MKAKNKNFRKRSLDEIEETAPTNNDLDEEQERRYLSFVCVSFFHKYILFIRRMDLFEKNY